jgi:apolipoprotein N-acyltransferase
MRVFINTEDKRWKKYNIDFEKIANAVVGQKYKNSEISVTLVGDRAIRKINKKYRKMDKATNVLSFELGDDILLGDIFISLDTVRKEAKRENIPVDEHTAHMLVHGILHLLGYDHIKDKDAEKMENKETIILKKLGYKNPYTADSGVCVDKSCCVGDKTIAWFKTFFNKPIGRSLLFSLFAVFASLGFAPFNMWLLSLIGIGGAYLLAIKCLTGQSGFRKFFRIAPFGAVYAMVMFWWVLHSIYVVPELANQFAVWTVPGLIGIGIVGALIFVWPFIAISSIRANPACRPILFAAIWTTVLWFREWLFTGFPWNPIANITLSNIYIANAMSLYGALGLTFVIIGLIASVCELINNRRNSSVWIVLLTFIVFGFVGVIYGAKNVRLSEQNCGTENLLIRVVQPAQSASQKATHSRAEAIQNANYNLQVLENLARAEGAFDLVIFPETSYPFVVIDGDDISVAKNLEAPIIIGANYYRDGNLYNSLLSVASDGAISNVYSKSHLVPFGEYRPFGNLVPTPGQLTKGSGPELVKVNLKNKDFVFAPAVCYEIIFSDSLVPDTRTPDAIINITNDNWFGKTPGTYQHLDMVRRYAIESGLPVIRANYSGISAFISPDGRIVSEIPIGMAGHMDGFVCGAHKTLYRTIGRDLWIIIILIVSCVGAISLYQISRKDN